MYKLYYLTSELDNMSPRYIGYTSKTLQERLKNHVRDCNRKKIRSHKKNWIKKVISSGFDVEIFLITEVDTLEEILIIERLYIESMFDYLVNSTNGGEISKVFKDDVKNKISQSLKEYFKTHKHYNIGRTYKLCDEHKEKISLSHIGIKNNFYGKNHTDDNKIKMGVKNIKYKQFTYDELYYLYIEKKYKINEIVKLYKSTYKSIQRQLTIFKINKKQNKKQMINLDEQFDNLLYQFSKGITYESYNNGRIYLELEKVKEWKSKFGYTFNIYCNDHFINNKPHFHFSNNTTDIYTKIDFEGNILESSGKDIPSKILKDLKFFLINSDIQNSIKNKWNEKNPNLKI